MLLPDICALRICLIFGHHTSAQLNKENSDSLPMNIFTSIASIQLL